MVVDGSDKSTATASVWAIAPDGGIAFDLLEGGVHAEFALLHTGNQHVGQLHRPAFVIFCVVSGLLLVVVTPFGQLSSGPTTMESRRLWPILYLNLLGSPTPKKQDSGHAPHGHRAVSILGSSNWSCLASFCLSIAYADQPLCPDSQVTS